MSVYKGSQKISDIYKGSTKIGQIYKGSQLVYQQNKQLNLYCYYNSGGSTGYYAYVVNEISTNSLVACGYGSSSQAFGTITNITGNLGEANSKIIQNNQNNYEYVYTDTKTVNGVKIYLYSNLDTESVFHFYDLLLVIEGSEVGSLALRDMLSVHADFHYPTYIDDSKIKTDAFTIELQRNSADDKIWTPNGVY